MRTDLEIAQDVNLLAVGEQLGQTQLACMRRLALDVPDLLAKIKTMSAAKQRCRADGWREAAFYLTTNGHVRAAECLAFYVTTFLDEPTRQEASS